MSEVPTHYANLHVARNAPPEVIRAAYKVLMQKYHPDRNPGNAEAERIVRLLNAAYAVLNDPGQRARHDAWITAQKARRLQAQLSQLAAPGKAGIGSQAPGRGRWWMLLAVVLAFALGMGLAVQMTGPARPAPSTAWRR
jgi:curved DNA-binding protein CbpA